MRGWQRKFYFDDLERSWVNPSPNIPSTLAALVFSGSVLFEGTNVSEGRGTTRPFELIGAPFVNPDRLAREMNKIKLKGVYFRPVYFLPTFQKWKDQLCGGIQIHVTDRDRFNAFKVGLALLNKIYEQYPKDFQWKKPPYEYEFEHMPIDLIAGTDALRKSMESGRGILEFERSADEELAQFKRLRRNYLLY